MVRSEEVVRYTYRVRPGKTALALLQAEWGRNRWLWNELVHQSISGKKNNPKSLSKKLTEARQKFSWLREGSVNTQQQTIRDYSTALNQKFSVPGKNFPKKRSRHKTLPTLNYVGDGFSITKHNILHVAKGIKLPVVWSRPLPSKPSSVRIFQDTLGHWYASFVVRRPLVVSSMETDSRIGIDWGVKTLATTTNANFDLPASRFLEKSQKELARWQRIMQRRYLGKGHPLTQGFKDAKRKVSKLHKKVYRQRVHEAKLWSIKVSNSHDIIAIEDINPIFMTTAPIAKQAADAGISYLKRELLYRAKKAGKTTILVKPAYTSQTCSGCMSRAKTALTLKQRLFICTNCNLCIDRDLNAARNILRAAEVELNLVHGKVIKEEPSTPSS